MRNIVSYVVVIAGLASCTRSVPADPPDLGVSSDLGAPIDLGLPFECGVGEFYEGSVMFPDGAMHYACSPAWPQGIAVTFTDAFTCRVLAANGASNGVEAGWSIGADGDWFSTLGSKGLWVVYQPSFTLHASFCPLGVSNCAFRKICQFEIAQAAHASGEVTEAHLTAPCLLDAPTGVPQPTLTSMRFRAHLSAQVVNDAGAMCAYP